MHLTLFCTSIQHKASSFQRTLVKWQTKEQELRGNRVTELHICQKISQHGVLLGFVHYHGFPITVWKIGVFSCETLTNVRNAELATNVGQILDGWDQISEVAFHKHQYPFVLRHYLQVGECKTSHYSDLGTGYRIPVI